MPPRTGAQIASHSVSMEPTLLRQDITIPVPETPSTSNPEPSAPAAALVISYDTRADLEAQLKNESVFDTDLTPYTKSDTFSSSRIDNSFCSTAVPAVVTYTNTKFSASNDNMVNKTRMEKQPKEDEAKTMMKEAVDIPIAVHAPPDSLVAGGKKGRRHKEDKGKGIAIDSCDNEKEVVDVPAKKTTAVDEPRKKKEAPTKARRIFESLERDRRRKLFESSDGFDVTLIFGKDKRISLAHREILVAESTWFSKHLPPADVDGKASLVMEGWTALTMGPVLSFLYIGVLPGVTVDPARKWDLRFVIFNVINYRTSAHLEINSGLEHFLGNIREAVNYYGPLLSGQFYHYKFYKTGSMETLEIPLRMSYIKIYEEKEKMAEMRELKLQVGCLFMVIMPFCLRQPSFKGPIKEYWTSLNFPWREDMKAFYEKGLLNEYAQMFDQKGNWIDEADPESEAQPEKLGIPGPSSAAPSHYASSIDEMAQKMRDAGVKNF